MSAPIFAIDLPDVHRIPIEAALGIELAPAAIIETDGTNSPAETAATLTRILGDAAAGSAAILLIGLDADRHGDVLPVVRSAVPLAYPVLVGTTDPADVLAAFRAGARDVIPGTASDDEIRAVLRRAQDALRSRQVAHQPPPDPTDARVIIVASPKGGVGRTALAVNLATTLAQRQPNAVALLDLDIQFGDVRHALSLNPQQSLVDLCPVDNLTPQQLHRHLTPHGSGLMVLPGTRSLVDAERFDPVDVGPLLALARATFADVVIDTAATFDDVTLAAFDAATHIVMATTPDIPSVRATLDMIDTLDGIGNTASRHLVINRSTERHGVSVADIEAACELRTLVEIPVAKHAMLAINQGVPVADVAPRSPFVRSIAQMAAGIDSPEAAPSASRRGPRSNRR